MLDLQGFAMELINKNPNVASNPQAQALLSVIQSGDAKKGEAIANNICASMGISQQDAIRQAKNFFHISM